MKFIKFNIEDNKQYFEYHNPSFNKNFFCLKSIFQGFRKKIFKLFLDFRIPIKSPLFTQLFYITIRFKESCERQGSKNLGAMKTGVEFIRNFINNNKLSLIANFPVKSEDPFYLSSVILKKELVNLNPSIPQLILENLFHLLRSDLFLLKIIVFRTSSLSNFICFTTIRPLCSTHYFSSTNFFHPALKNFLYEELKHLGKQPF